MLSRQRRFNSMLLKVTMTIDAFAKTLRTAGASASYRFSHVFSFANARRASICFGSLAVSASLISFSESFACEANRMKRDKAGISGIGTETRGLAAARIAYALTGLVGS